MPFGSRFVHAVLTLPAFHELQINMLTSDGGPLLRRGPRNLRKNGLTTLEAGAFDGATSLEVL